MGDVNRYIEEHLPEALAELQELCKLPSVSAQNSAIPETAKHVAGMLKACGFEAQILPKAEEGKPVVYAFQQGRSDRTLLFYNHYDVQPAEPLELWSSPPFEPTLTGEKLYGRGVCDNKGNIAARLAAINAIRATRGSLPCSVKFCIEGDEEIGSPHMEAFVEEKRHLLAADACIWEGGGVNWEGVPQVSLGVKGLLYVELEATGASHDAHSSYGTVIPNPAWRLVWALSTLKDWDENVLIEGFYDDVRPPTPEEQAAVEAMPEEEEETLRAYGLNSFVRGLRGLPYRMRHIFQPTATLDGLLSGYTGPGPKTVLPARAMAKMDFRLVPNQDPDDILEKLTRHLARHGFGDIDVRCLSGERPARTPITDPFVKVVTEAARQVYGVDPLIVPSIAGTGPLYPFAVTLGLPTADCGIGYPDARIHAPDENIRIDDFLKGTKTIAALIERFGEV